MDIVFSQKRISTDFKPPPPIPDKIQIERTGQIE